MTGAPIELGEDVNGDVTGPSFVHDMHLDPANDVEVLGGAWYL